MSVLEPFLPFSSSVPRRSIPWTALAGWSQESFKDVDLALASSLLYLEKFDTPPVMVLKKLLTKMKTINLKKPDEVRSFLKGHFSVHENIPQANDFQRFTGYYEPVVLASRCPKEGYTTPIYRRPPELLVIEDMGYFRDAFKGHRIAGVPQGGTLIPFYKSKDLWHGILKGQSLEIAWAKSAIDVFFMHIQGSALLLFENGDRLHITYDGTNGHPYAALGKVLREKGLLYPHQQSMEGIRQVLEENRHSVYDLLSLNESYVFFKELEAEGPYNRLGTPLIPHRSLAVDPLYVPLGSLVWIDAPPYYGLRFAHDVGAAIKGPVRGDIFCGQGEKAGQEAGSLNISGRLFVMVPL